MTFYGAEVLCVMEHLHNCNIIFRDLKPEHVILDQQGHCNLVDFGFAKQFKSNRSRREMRTYTNCGTPTYIAPEVLKGAGSSFEVDIWSFGVLISEIISGTTPFFDESPMKTYENVVFCRPKYHTTHDSNIRDLLNRIFVTDPGSRISIEDIKTHTVFK